MFLWTKFVKCEPTRDLILHTGSFVDDSYFYSQSENSEEVAALIVETWKNSLQFDLIAGLQTNTNKSFLFANSGQVVMISNKNWSIFPLMKDCSFVTVSNLLVPSLLPRVSRIFRAVIVVF